MILGIDTSCYTTSLAVVDDEGSLLADCRRLLPVAEGACGLAQSQAFFMHLMQAPQLLRQIYETAAPQALRVVAASTRPRPLPDSYMPVFRVGENMGRMLADTLHLPFFATSHQEAHLAAALWSLDKPLPQRRFLALHLSGGTGELLRVEKKPGGFDLDIVGDCDLAPGQYIDRIGVALGLPFPAGAPLEELARQAAGSDLRLPLSVRESHIYFCGPQSAAKRLLDGGTPPCELAYAVFSNIAQSLAQAILFAAAENDLYDVVLAGGVMANSIIKEQLSLLLQDSVQLHFAGPRFAGDNAVGVALLAGGLEDKL